MGGRWIALALLTVAGPAWAQSEEDYDKYAQPLIDSFVACAKPKVEEMAKMGGKAPDAIVDAATSECQSHLDELKQVIMKPPFGWSSERAEVEIKSMLQQMRKRMLETAQGI